MCHLAQVNIGRVLGGPDDPRMTDFYSNLARVNSVADRMPGFVWRLKNADGNSAVGIHWPGDPTMAVNLSVWENADTLAKFVFQTVHRNIYARKSEFFELPREAHFAMWWIRVGHIPTLEEAKERLNHYVQNGSTEFAFGWADLPSANFLQTHRCA